MSILNLLKYWMERHGFKFIGKTMNLLCMIQISKIIIIKIICLIKIIQLRKLIQIVEVILDVDYNFEFDFSHSVN